MIATQGGRRRPAPTTREDTVAQLARMIGVSKSSIYFYISKSMIPHTRRGGRIAIDSNEARAALAANPPRPGRPPKVENARDVRGDAPQGYVAGQPAAQLGTASIAVEPVQPTVSDRECGAAAVVEPGVPDASASEVTPRRKVGRPIDPTARRFNAVLRKLIQDDDLDVGNAATLLAEVTGLDYAEIRRRVDEVEHTYGANEKTGADELAINTNDRKYLVSAYSKSKDPDVRAWLESIKRTDPAAELVCQ
jgi:hypothetical protein